MASGKAIVLGLGGLGAIALLLKHASSSTSAAPAAQKTYVDTSIDAIKAKAAATTAKGSKIDKAKGYVAKGSAEAQAAIDAVDKLLK